MRYHQDSSARPAVPLSPWLAGALAAWSLLRPADARTGDIAPATDQQTADAKARACATTTPR